MPNRHEVYAAIAGEIEFLEDEYRHRCAVEDLIFVAPCNRTTDQFLVSMANYNNIMLASMWHDEYDALPYFRTLGALSLMCIENNGAPPRNLNTGDSGTFIEPPLSRKKAQRIVDTEREYQNSLGTNVQIYSIDGFAVMFQYYLSKAYESCALNPGDEYCLDIIRKLAGICVHCQERHGLRLREPFKS